MKTFIALLLVLLMSTSTWAQSVPNTGTLYRMDTRSPNKIFKSGFSAWGSNQNLVDHASGMSCARTASLDEARTTAFIALTSNRAFVQRLARVASGVAEDGLSYLYALRSNANMYDLGLSLEAAGSHTQKLRAIAAYQSEWIAYRRIDQQDIISVEIYERGRFERSNPNPQYRMRPETINTSPFVAHTQPASAPRSIYYARIGSMLSTLCAAALPCVHNSTKRSVR